MTASSPVPLATRAALSKDFPVLGNNKNVGIPTAHHLGDRHNEATILTHLGDTHHATGNHQAARGVWQQALAILDDLNHPNADQLRTKLATLNTPTPDPTNQDTHHNGEPVG